MRACLILPFVLVPALAAAQRPALTLAAATGSSTVIESRVTLDSPPSGPAEWFAKSDQRWLTVSPRTGLTPARVAVRADPAGLAPGVHRAVLRFVDDAGVAMLVVPVTLTLETPAAAAPPPAEPSQPSAHPAPTQTTTGGTPGADDVLSMTLDTLPPVTRNLPYAQAITVKGGTPPYAIRIAEGRLPRGLALTNGSLTGVTRYAGLYPLVIAVTDSSSPAKAATKALTLRVIVAYQNTVLSLTAASLSLSATAGRPPAPGARVGVGSGAVPLAWLAVADQAWLRLAPDRGVAPAGFQVEADARHLAPGSYVATVTVTMDGAPNSPMRIPVQLTVRR